MKKVISFLLTLSLVLGVSMNVKAEKPNLSPKEVAKIEKEAKKSAKKKAKELVKDGWKIEQSCSLEDAIARHNAAIQREGLTEKVGTADNMKTRSICRKKNRGRCP